MIKSLLVGKKFGTYADTFLMLGLALLAEYALKKTQQNPSIQLIDEGTHYRIQFKKPVNLESIALLAYTNPFPPVCGKKTDRSQLPPETPIFDVVEWGEVRKLYREYLYQNHGRRETGEDTPKPPHPSTQNSAILTSMRHDKNHNKLWLIGWELRDHYGILLTSIFQAFSQSDRSTLKTATERVAELFFAATGCKLSLQASAVKVYLPTSIQGVVSAYNLKTRTLTLNGTAEIGTTGWARYRFNDPEQAKVATILAHFAEFAGVGRKTAMGMGYVALRSH
ncbi:CRISPR system precrRNA processing endoribonuclease RAMP protein Cas6 [Allocoleopsis franciscana]|uniref:CRISPR-associated protein Cas6 C-terminal domain-containing protein n=1 Tax=Allocoleopsis franciscana PCC 7113 TaxID=1173027 RepID=K9WP69_9CYAN|nr:CRISPR system precrRNA processing endoribonuclease RAMP protein Cas6 [Allocoleopsis franciscana]AFZ22190.1 hypothetical protein Mic7113_6620 [Allocoleopsis franciscana PCC 7113]